jgi:ABC-type multidrug transport system ATPase subunit
MFQLQQVSLRAGAGWRLRNINLILQAESTAIIGYSGAGKSSLLNVLVGYEKSDSGQIRRPTQTEPSGGRLPFFWVPQNGGLWPHLTTEQHLQAVIPQISGRSTGFSISSDEILDHLALTHKRHSRPSQLSLGESSRLAVARGLASCAGWLLMDEPLSHVDPVRKPAFWQSVHNLARATGTRLVFSCHEPEFVLRHAEHVVCLHEGEICWSGTVQQLFEDPPSAELGRFLGPLNWWTQAEAALLNTACETLTTSAAVHPRPLPAERGLRPQHIRIHRVAAGGFPILHSRSCGLYHQTQLQLAPGHPLTVLHSISPPFMAGETVCVSAEVTCG